MLVQILASNYKQHILSPPKVRQICYSLAELRLMSVYLNLFGWRKVHETFYGRLKAIKGAHPASCRMGTGGPFPGGKARPGRDADYSPPSSAEVVNE
jgi:hypothetical protein